MCKKSPDIIPNITQTLSGYFYLPPNDGSTFIGLLSSNCNNNPNLIDFKESLGQQLSTMLLANQDYYFFVKIATPSKLDLLPIGKLIVYLGIGGTCDSSQVIHTSYVADTVWRTEYVQFRPRRNSNFITFASASYLGNGCLSPPSFLFIDNLSPIYEGVYTGIDSPNSSTEEKISIYPNPADEQTIINLGELSKTSSKLTICVSNSLGKCLVTSVINPTVGNYTLDTRELPSGVYYVKISQSEGNLHETLKLMVVR